MKSMGNDVSHSPTQGFPIYGEGWSKVPLPFWKIGVEVEKKEASTERGVADLRDQGPGCDGFNIGMLARGDWKQMMKIQWPKVGVY